MKTVLDEGDVARVIHEAHRAYQYAVEDLVPVPPWDALDKGQREQVISLVRLIRGGVPVEQAHDAWVRRMREAGWVPGNVKDPVARTHPELVPFRELLPWQQAKLLLAFRVGYVLLFESRDEVDV